MNVRPGLISLLKEQKIYNNKKPYKLNQTNKSVLSELTTLPHLFHE
jgi:hypothetical protein